MKIRNTGYEFAHKKTYAVNEIICRKILSPFVLDFTEMQL